MIETNSNKEEIEDECKIEMITAKASQEYLKSLKADYKGIITEGDAEVQKSKQEMHQLRIKFH